MRIIVATTIVVDKPTTNGNIYPRDTIEKAICEFNNNAKTHPIKGGIINKKHIAQCGDITHEARSLFINDSGVLCVEVELLDRDLIEKYMNGMGLVARPLISIPAYIESHRPMTVSVINKIIRVQLECGNDQSE